jgi:hypothetical protein
MDVQRAQKLVQIIKTAKNNVLRTQAINNCGKTVEQVIANDIGNYDVKEKLEYIGVWVSAICYFEMLQVHCCWILLTRCMFTRGAHASPPPLPLTSAVALSLGVRVTRSIRLMRAPRLSSLA